MMGLRDGTKVVTTATSPCAHLRFAYHDCFNSMWYLEKFLKGQWDKLECVADWDKYRACLAKHLEDKHLRRILLEEETFPYTRGDSFSATDADGEVRQ